jgi:YfiH family protein
MTVPCRRFDSLAPYEAVVAHGVFTRHGGVSAHPFASLNVSYSVGDRAEDVAKNRTYCAEALDLPLTAVTVAGLVHGAAVGIVGCAATEPLPDGTRLAPQVDALISAKPGQALLITAADCLQVFLLDPVTPAIGLAHAGWRGLVQGTIGATVKAMHDAYGSQSSDIRACIGPGLGPCCAEFTDPRRELPASFSPYIQGRNVDLWAAAEGQLRAAGLDAVHVDALALCTRCHRDQFFSHRGDHGRTGRFAAIIALRPAASTAWPD